MAGVEVYACCLVHGAYVWQVRPAVIVIGYFVMVLLQPLPDGTEVRSTVHARRYPTGWSARLINALRSAQFLYKLDILIVA